MVIKGAGNVGIGTNAPQSNVKLHVNGVFTAGDGVATSGTDRYNPTQPTIAHTVPSLASDGGTLKLFGVGGGSDQDNGAHLFFGGQFRTTSNPDVGFAKIVGAKESADSTLTYPGYLAFYTRPHGGDHSEKVRITSEGYLKQHNVPAFHAYGFAAHVYANDDTNRDPLKYNSVHYNQGSHYSTSTGRFTAPVDGIYFFAMSAMYRHVGGDFHIGIKVNNVSKTISNDHQEYQGSGFAVDGDLHTWVQSQSTLTALLSANDYVTCYMGSSTNSGTYLYNSSNYNHFCGFLVG